MAIKILIGGSPCTHWSIAQKKNRETEPSGMGWELFENYLIAKEKFKPDFFLYENNKSAAQAIKDQIAKELGVGVDPDVRFTYINSALVSAQNRQRFYVTNFGDIEQPEDRGILLKDILEYGIPFRKDKSHCIDANYFKGGNLTGFNRQSGQRLCVAEPVNMTADGKAQCLRATCYKDGIRNMVANDVDKRTCVAEPVCVAQRGRYSDSGNRSIKSDGLIEQFYEAREDGNTNALTTVQKDNAVAEPVCMRYERSEKAKKLRKQYEAGEIHHGFHELSELHPRTDGKTNTLSTVLKDNPICEPVRVGDLPSKAGKISGSQATRIYDIDGKSVCLQAGAGGQGARTGLYAISVPIEYPIRKNSTVVVTDNNIRCRQNKNGATVAESCCYFEEGKCGTLTTARSPMIIESIDKEYYQGLFAIPTKFEDGIPVKAVSCADGKEYPVYEVKDGQITIRGKTYPIKLIDGYYIIRKLTVTECCRLQTLPDDYCKAVSATQAYKALGNGWTAEVIIHLLNHALKDVPRNEEIVVLSLYDGIGTGRYCLDKMGFTNVKYYAYEIDKYPMAIANDNYPDIIQCGDAFAVREDSWKPPKTRSEWLDELLGG